MNASPTQRKQREWLYQWQVFQDREQFLFQDWIQPLTLESFRGQEVLECGCGSGQHTRLMAPYAKHITAVDLNAISVARQTNQGLANVEFIEGDIATMKLERRFDIAISIGVVHHTDDPDRAVANMILHLKPGGRLALWVYSKEGNFLVEYVLEPIRKLFLSRMPRWALILLSRGLTALLALPVFTLYRLPLPGLPYYDYFRNFRRLSFSRNVLNVFDKLNAPQVQFITHARIESWFDPKRFEDVQISSYCGVSWRGSGRLRAL